MIFLLSTDDKYAMPTGVLMLSICINNMGHHDFYILSGQELSLKSQELIRRNLLSYDVSIHFIMLPESIKTILPMGKDGQPEYISIATYYRLFAQNLVPSNIDKILYLDSDIICRGSLNNLWNTNIDGCPIAGVYEIENNDGRYLRLGYPAKEGYINAGVLLINLKFWRENNAIYIFTEFIKKSSHKIVFHDQDIINTVFHGKIKSLPLTYNVLNSYYVTNNYKYLYNQDEVNNARLNPLIVHYSSHLKPWIKGCSHPFTRDFLHYHSLSVWKKEKLKPFPSASFKGKLANILVALGLYKYNGNYITFKH